ncbi:dockerin type I domain-containing protein [Desulfobacula sp.]|uniref:dockerin type I domain-containing protein n=1 Tax=Desulfobacula sp. TaxID=2593537 RepID=UPI00263623BF|nr:dockerin type I domain-containing protein [Desulfobacula sp.]
MSTNGLACCATLVVLIAAAVTASASEPGVFPIKIEDATYNERVSAPLWGGFTGSDINAAEIVLKSATKSTGDPGQSFTYTVVGMSTAKGPEAAASVDISSAANEPGTAGVSAGASALNEFYLVVYNRMGTATSQLVPVYFKTKYNLELSYSGEVSYAACGAWLNVWAADGQTRILAVSETLSKGSEVGQIVGDTWPPHKVQVQVGFAALSYYKMKVVQGANARGDVHAWATYNMAESGTGTVNASAWIDPAIYIDPNWEYADDFGLAFSPNMQPPPMPNPGDYNNDNEVNLKDVVLLLQLMSSMEPVELIYKSTDVNGDGKLGMGDLLYTLRKVSGAAVAPMLGDTLQGGGDAYSCYSTRPVFTGTGGPGQTITVQFEDPIGSFSTVVGADGQWVIDLSAPADNPENWDLSNGKTYPIDIYATSQTGQQSVVYEIDLTIDI